MTASPSERICVVVGRTRHKMVQAEIQEAARRGARLIEVRLDFLAKAPDFKRLLADKPCAVMATVRRPADGGRWAGTEPDRRTLLRQAIVGGFDWVDLETDIADAVPRFGRVRRVVSYHNLHEVPGDLEKIHEKMCGQDPDVVKIAVRAQQPEDNLRMLRLVQDAPRPTVAFCMGDMSMPSRVLGIKYGAPFTYAAFNPERGIAPGLPSFDELKHIYHIDAIDGETQVFGVIGDPVAHSLSPLIHNAAFAHERLNKVYLPFRVPKDDLPQTVSAFDWFPVEGYSVTLPHKEDVLGLTSGYDGPTREIGAANTLYRMNDGAWRAANTDHDAALECLVRELQPDPAAGTDASLSALAGRKVLILGAGGVARAIARGIVNHGGVLMIANRTKARAEELADQFGCLLVEWQNRGAVFADVLVNCTSVGMHPNLDETPFAENWLREGMVVFDTIYNPERTLLIKHARERECKTITGIDMFVRQAAQQFELFTGQAAPVEVMRDVIRQAISAARPE